MDGNGRWAKSRGLPRKAGHAAGAETFRTIATFAINSFSLAAVRASISLHRLSVSS